MIREQPDLWQRLVPIASHESAEARIWAIRMGRLCLPTQPEAVSVWYEFVLDETRSLPDRGQAIYALATAPSLTIEQCNTLTDLLVNDLGRLHWAANAALVTRTESSLPVLQQRLPSAPPELQTKILHCLRQMGTKAAESRELVKNEFSSSEPTVRAAAGSAWWNITGQAEPVVALLLDELEQEPSADVFDLCIELGKEGAKLSDSIARHLRVSRDSETFDPLIAEALGSIGPAAKQHVDLLDQSLSRGSNKWFGQVAVARVSIARSAGGVADEFGCRLGKAIDLGIEDNEALRETLDLLRAGKLLGKHVAECQPQLSELYLIMQEKATRQLVLNVFKAIGKPSLGSLESLAKHPGLGDRARRSLERTISQINRD